MRDDGPRNACPNCGELVAVPLQKLVPVSRKQPPTFNCPSCGATLIASLASRMFGALAAIPLLISAAVLLPFTRMGAEIAVPSLLVLMFGFPTLVTRLALELRVVDPTDPPLL